MDSKALNKIAEEIKKSIDKYDIDYERFSVHMYVTPEYFDRVKDDLCTDMLLTTSDTHTEVGKGWIIMLSRLESE